MKHSDFAQRALLNQFNCAAERVFDLGTYSVSKHIYEGYKKEAARTWDADQFLGAVYDMRQGYLSALNKMSDENLRDKLTGKFMDHAISINHAMVYSASMGDAYHQASLLTADTAITAAKKYPSPAIARLADSLSRLKTHKGGYFQMTAAWPTNRDGTSPILPSFDAKETHDKVAQLNRKIQRIKALTPKSA